MATLKAMFKLFDGYSVTIDKINRGTDAATDKIIRASRGTDEFNNKLAATGASANTAFNGLKKLVGAFLSLAALKKGMDITDEYINTASRLSLINDGLQTQAELQDKIFAAADRARGSYSDMADAVAKMGLLAGDAFGSNDELIAFTELMQKSFKIGGADTAMQQGAMRQLTQAMASGRLQGDELTSIMENASMMYDAIAKYTGKSKGELKEMGSQGKITADIIKNSMFMAANDINTKFETLPITFGDIWNKIKRDSLKAFEPVMQKINRLINTDKFKATINGLMNGLKFVANTIGNAIDTASRLGTFISDNWSMIAPIIWGIIGALVVYNATMGIAWWTTIKDTAAKVAHTVASWLETAAILALIAAQDGLNVALAACPLTWIITGIIILITLFYAAVAAVNRFAGTTISATGTIAGDLMEVSAFVGNLFVGLWSLILDIAASIWNVVATLGEFFANIFVDPLNSAVRLFAGMADSVLGILEGIASAIDTIFGSNLVAAVSKWRNGLKGSVNGLVGEAKIKIPRLDTSSLKLDRFEYSTAWDKGYNWGKGVENKISSLAGLLTGTGDFGKDLGTYVNPVAVKGTGKDGAVKVDMSDEDLKYLRDIAERDYINKFSTATLAPNITVQFGDVHEEADANKVAGRIKKILQEEIATAAEGAY